MSGAWGDSVEDVEAEEEDEPELHTADQDVSLLRERVASDEPVSMEDVERIQPEQVEDRHEELFKEAYSLARDAETELAVADLIHDNDFALPEGDTEQSSLDAETAESDSEASGGEDDTNASREGTGMHDFAGVSADAHNATERDTAEADDASEGITEQASDGPGSFSMSEATERQRRWRFLVWGEPGVGKTHFAFSMPEPLAFIDTEGKAHEIAYKFEDKDGRFWQPTEYDEALASLDEALDWLDERREETGQRGTLVVDSMADMWEWAQTKYVEVSYPMQDPEEKKGDFSAKIGESGQSDWQQIKSWHNARFRNKITRCPYHVCWTAMEKDDIAENINGDAEVENPKKAAGEKNNEYKVNHVLRLREYGDDIVGDLVKSGLTRYQFRGLEFPVREGVTSIVEEFVAAEESGEEPDLDEDVKVLRGN